MWPSVVRPARRAKFDSNALVLAGSPKGRALEIGAVIDPDHFREPDVGHSSLTS